MFKGVLKRLAVGSCFALLAALVAVAVGEADGPRQEGPVRTDCDSCHASVVETLAGSEHGQAFADPVFQETWQEQGSPDECLACHTTGYDPESGTYDAAGLTCFACHSPASGPHPEVPMSVDSSSRLCGECHIDTHSEWEDSAHGEGEMGCVKCHNPHTSGLKVSGTTELCTVCHNEEGHFYNFTGHANSGLTCTDCHLRVSESTMGEGHGKRVHTFEVDLDTCTQCHGQEMHFPVGDTAMDEVDEAMMVTAYSGGNDDLICRASGPVVNSNPEPAPAQPLYYLLVAAVGLGFGIAVTPWAEDLFRRFNGNGQS